MRTVKRNPFFSGALMLLGGMLVWAGVARAEYTSTDPAAILIFPKVVVDTTKGIDTVIQISNTSPVPVNVRCYLVNAGAPQANGLPPKPTGRAPSVCTEIDFRFSLSPFQPIVWLVSTGTTWGGDSIPPAPLPVMYGELKCVEVNDAEAPTDSNDLKGEATIESVTVSGGQLTAADIDGYNAIGLRAAPGLPGQDPSNPNALKLGSMYDGCPLTLILDHFFDNAVEPSAAGDTVTTHLVLVPCTENFNTQTWPTTPTQFLVFNEFEQRFSTSISTGCFTELPLSDIGSLVGNEATSIFNVAVQGTLTGQTRIRGVDAAQDGGNGLIGVAEEFHTSGSRVHTASFGLVETGIRTPGDTITLAPPQF